MEPVKGGVYIIRCDPCSIKIGMSDNIERRLKQYTGYQGSAKPVERLLIVYTKDFREFEKMSHSFASDYGLPRHLPFEVFDCTREQQDAFLSAYVDHITNKYKHRIDNIQQKFISEIQQAPYVRPPASNMTKPLHKHTDQSDSLQYPILDQGQVNLFAKQLEGFKYCSKQRAK